MTRKKIKEFLEEQLKKLQEAHVAELMKSRRDEELEAILADVKLDSFLIETFEQPVYMSRQEIPKQFIYELVCYINKSGLPNWHFFEDDFNFISILRDTDEKVAEVIASLMTEQDLRYYTIKNFLYL